MQVDEKENNKMIINVLHNGCFKKVSPVQFNSEYIMARTACN